MRRRTFDSMMAAGGFVLTVVLLVAGGLLMWGYTFANNNVHDQLTAQRIYFPPKGSDALEPPEIGKYLNKYAGQQLTNGAQAEAYANHYIGVHLKEVAGGKTYAEVSNQARANPTDQELQGQVETLFRGEALRGLLLDAYAFWKMGQIALYGAIVSFALAGIMLILSVLGLLHLRRVATETELWVPGVRQKEVVAT